MSSYPLATVPSGLRGLTPVNGDSVVAEGPLGTQNPQVYVMPAWAKMNDAARVRWLREFATEYGHDPAMRWHAVSKVLRPQGVRARDYPGMADALLKYIHRTVYYTMEPGECIQSPWRTLQVGTGDCDDSAILLASLAESVGLPWRFYLVGRKRGSKKMLKWLEGQPVPRNVEFFHIALELGGPPGSPKHWLSAEQTLAGVPLGYSIVDHGLVTDDWGRPKLRETILQMQQGGPQMQGGNADGFYGGLGASSMPSMLPRAAAMSAAATGDEPGLMQELSSKAFWQRMTIAAFEAAIISATTFLAMRYVEKYYDKPARRARKKRKRSRA